jgi:tetratricopeptide (TPR) repeat protein|uniref:Tetratricopeptide repeat protein n=1 Tax=Desulfobacca acetoxidans TaxID=60893 RepID=A0A7V6A370_9BACT
MPRKKPQFRGAREPEELIGAAQQALNYLAPYLRWLILGATALGAVLLIWAGYSYFQHRQEVQAQAALQKVRPELNRPDQAEAALKSLTAVVQQYPSTQAARMALAFKAHLLYQTRKYAEAAKIYEELRASGGKDPYAWGPFVTESLAYCYEAEGQYAKAAQTLKPLVDQSLGSYQTMLLTHLALLYDKAGEHKLAADSWQRLMTLTHDPALVSYWKERLAEDKAGTKDTGKN